MGPFAGRRGFANNARVAGAAKHLFPQGAPRRARAPSWRRRTSSRRRTGGGRRWRRRWPALCCVEVGVSDGVVCCYAGGVRGPTTLTPILQVFPAATISQAGQSDARERPFGSQDRKHNQYFGTNPKSRAQQRAENFYSQHQLTRTKFRSSWTRLARTLEKSTSRVGPGAPPTPRHFFVSRHRRFMFYILL